MNHIESDKKRKQFQSEIDRILESNLLHTSETSRKLLRFLAEKTISGEADLLKEYTVAVDALDRSAAYDPRHESTVRIQMGRLRQKLAEYYRTEGQNSDVIIDLPKGRFKLSFVRRNSPALRLDKNQASPPSLLWAAGLVLLTCLITTATLWTLRPSFAESSLGLQQASWNRDLEELWRPALSGERPLIIAVEDPLFVSLQSDVTLTCRDYSLNAWDEVENSPSVLRVRKALHNPEAQPSHYYAPFGEVTTSFLLGRALGARARSVSMIRTSEISEQQIADSDVVFVGNQGRFQEQLASVPIQPQLVLSSSGVKDLHPANGAPAEYRDPDSRADDGEVYSLVAHLPGPLGRSDLWVFTSRHSAGSMAAVKWFTDPVLAHELVSRLRLSNHKMPGFYQILLRVKYQDQVPGESTVVLTRDLDLTEANDAVRTADFRP